jgi:hypothetical protein
MDEKLDKYSREQFDKLFYGFPEPSVRRKVLLDIYYAGCAAQHEADRKSITSRIRPAADMNKCSDYERGLFAAMDALAAAAIKE